MKQYAMYFSPTGGTKKVMDILKKEWGLEEEIDLSQLDYDYSNYHFEKEDVCLIGVPSYGGRVPAVALERIRQMKADGTPVVLVVVYGNRDYDDTILELKNEVTACGFCVKAAIAAAAEHSIMRQFGTGRPDAEDEKELCEAVKKIKDSWDKKQESKELSVPGNMPYKEYNGLPLKPTGNKDCSKCGTCAASCPVGAIPKENPASVDKRKCISCMRCVAVCPKNARSVNKVALFAASKKLEKACSGRKKNQIFL